MQLRVFIVEDLPTMQVLLKSLFAALGGIEVIGGAGTEAEANLWLLENPGAWDVALIDLVLDQGSGMSVIRRARKSHPTGKVAVFSSFASPVVSQHCLALGADAVFSKAETAAFVSWLSGQCAQRAQSASDGSA